MQQAPANGSINPGFTHCRHDGSATHTRVFSSPPAKDGSITSGYSVHGGQQRNHNVTGNVLPKYTNTGPKARCVVFVACFDIDIKKGPRAGSRISVGVEDAVSGKRPLSFPPSCWSTTEYGLWTKYSTYCGPLSFRCCHLRGLRRL